MPAGRAASVHTAPTGNSLGQRLVPVLTERRQERMVQWEGRVPKELPQEHTG